MWTPAFANIMRDNMLIRVGGNYMGIDMNIEHLIKEIKRLATAKGIYSDWVRFGHLSACLKEIHCIKNNVATDFQLSYKNKTSKEVDTQMLVWRVVKHASANDLLTFNADREGNDTCKSFVDIHAKGHKLLETSSLKTFNKKMHAYIDGMPFEEEEDDIPLAEYESNIGIDVE
ncbi:hypothetical protein EV359DRAFT_47534 [Lentinula novae-zelandiae]|nr:hypothetical protein EV359DRAFT_47534 [Lentinula novae-zelandiae]